MSVTSKQRARVFVGSLMDWAECRDDAQREMVAEIWPIIREAKELDFLMLTKRPQNIRDLLPDDWGHGYPNVWLMTSVESGLTKHKDRTTGAPVRERLHELSGIPAAILGISYEPAIGPLAGYLEPYLPHFEWVIYGGESGAGFRPEGEPGDPKAWAREMSQACENHGCAFFHKQSAAFRNEQGVLLHGLLEHEYPLSVGFDFEGAQ